MPRHFATIGTHRAKLLRQLSCTLPLQKEEQNMDSHVGSRERSPHIERARDLRRNATATERLLWLALKGKQMRGMKFRRQHPIGAYFADFACLSARLIVKLDGERHS